MSINTLYDNAVHGSRADEDRLFEVLSVRFRLFAHQRVWDEEDAREIAQEALMRVGGQYRDIDIHTSFAAWAYQILINEIRNFVRKKARRGDRVERISDTDLHAEAWQADPDLEPQLLDCVRKLADRNIRYARILNLSYQGFGTEDICRKMNISKSNFYVILSRARAMLKQCLEKGDIEG